MPFIRGPIGFDFSFYQDDDNTPHKIDFQKTKDWGGQFVILRAGQGNWPDEDFRDFWHDAKGILPRASYYFYDPRVSPERQAYLWAQQVSSDPPEGRLWADFEFPASWGGDFTNWRYWKTFIEETKRLTGLRIGIYTGSWWWNSITTNQRADIAYFARYPLWNAQYTALNNVTYPRGWSEMMLWQFGTPAIGADVGAESAEVDINQWNDEFNFATEWGQAVTPVPTPGGSMKYKVVWTNGVARRTAPSTSNTYTGKTYLYNETVEVVEDNIPDREDPTNANKKWVKFADGLYGASVYPSSLGVPQTRMVKVQETPLPSWPPEIGITIGTETRIYVPRV